MNEYIKRFHLDVQVRVPVECRLLEIDANVEGRWVIFAFTISLNLPVLS